jgi:hypothetical protein
VLDRENPLFAKLEAFLGGQSGGRSS